MSATKPRPVSTQVLELESHVERLQGRINYLSVVSDALVRLFGEEAVQAKIDEMHLERLQPIAAAHKVNTAKAVEEGKIAVVNEVTPGSILVAIERNQRNAITGLRAQIAMPLVPELHSLFVGKKVGEVVTVTKNEVTTTYELLEIYEPTAKGLGQVDEKASEAN